VQGEVLRELERRFPPEFRNRIDEVVLFAPLTHDEVRAIARNYMQKVTLTLGRAGKTIDVSDDALEVIVDKGYNIAFGARFLKRFIDEHIKLPISAHWKEGSHFEVRVHERRHSRRSGTGESDVGRSDDRRRRLKGESNLRQPPRRTTPGSVSPRSDARGG
jgi:ATP-dependent Clp protease ATP-binding subunit ClpA